MKRVLLVCVSLLTLTACTSMHTSPTPAPSTTAPSTTAATPDCDHARKPHRARPTGLPAAIPDQSRCRLPEVEGSGKLVQLWGLIMADGPDDPLRVNEQVKIIWRIAGSGELRLTSIGPDGGMHRLEWGPDAHCSGTYRRPGQEWGAGYRFTQPGRWDLHAIRGNATADIWLNLASCESSPSQHSSTATSAIRRRLVWWTISAGRRRMSLAALSPWSRRQRCQ